MEGLPLIPGYTFQEPAIQDYKLKQKFGFLNGFRVIRDSDVGIGRRPIDAASSAYAIENETVHYDPSLTYGRVREYGYQQFFPHYTLYAQKCLCFKAFFRQGVFGSPHEHFRIRYVNIIYYLEDETLSVIEPRIDNAGFNQGRLVRRGKIVKNSRGDVFHWKDLNVGIDIGIYGVVYHTYDCDRFTKEFLTSQGIDVGERGEPPPDPYIKFRKDTFKIPTRTTPVADDTRRRFLEYDGMVLLFDAVWDDDFYQILYFLTDDTISVKEIHTPNDGKDPVSMLLKKAKVPKNWKDLPPPYPGIYMERGDPDVVEYYTPKDLMIGDTIFIFGRRFFLYDCDAFTRKYYSGMLGIVQPARLDPPIKNKKSKKICRLPSHDSTPPKKDAIRHILNFPKRLRYSMKMDAVHPEDQDRNFILEYNLSDDTILISERAKPNSGRKSGIFLSSRPIPKPRTDNEDPVYYTPEDFSIGSKINVFNHYFIITGADLFVYRYMEANTEKFSQQLRDNMRNYFVQKGLLQDDIDALAKKEANELLNSNIEENHEDDFDIEPCLSDFEKEARHKYAGEPGKLKPPMPPPEELCPNLTSAKKEEIDDVRPCEFENREIGESSARREIR
ncbi:EF-hand domain-containing protein 1-like [Belonocnema kinseyi]|uniref:EF-hand domain-containing protein 1-like n=1 Tax=Belonocnema kinseyi TaxID=2817044 RepID=UPI00143DC627|nr:EF-hand domain-containing protein 1-like [Belonocnema kinseyi]XP_033209843.1 EF-hand domain-containing protein 1-like [Belonocnema kinseyi]XP_033209844.1 EF-hand domain-containing protein 1-like [Belonocnema kinseyi]